MADFVFILILSSHVCGLPDEIEWVIDLLACNDFCWTGHLSWCGYFEAFLNLEKR